MKNATIYPHYQRDLATVGWWHKSSRYLWVRPWMNESTRLVHKVNYYFSLTVHRWWLEEIRLSQLVPGLKRYLHTPIGNFPLNKMSKNKLCRWVLRTSQKLLHKHLWQSSFVTKPLRSPRRPTYMNRYPIISTYLCICDDSTKTGNSIMKMRIQL